MYKPSEHQAAGHDGCLTDADETLFIKLTSPQEVEFYTAIMAHDLERDDSDDVPLLAWMPQCMGLLMPGDVTNQPAAKPDQVYVVLENLYAGFKRPCIMDIKLGAKLTDDTVTAPEKIERLQKVSDATTSGSHHFRVCGMKLYNQNSEEKPSIVGGLDDTVTVVKDKADDAYLEFNKFYGRQLTLDTVVDGIRQFFGPILAHGPSPHAKLVVKRLVQTFLKRLQLLYNTLLDYEVRMFSALLLLMYEGDLSRWHLDDPVDDAHLLVDDDAYDSADPLLADRRIADDDDDEDDTEDTTPTARLSQLNLIDFAHSRVTKGEGHDDNVIEGVAKLIDVFTAIDASI